MTTLIVKDRGAEAKHFLDYAKKLPYVKVVEEKKTSEKELRPCVAASIRKSMRGEDLIYSDSLEDFFKELGLR